MKPKTLHKCNAHEVMEEQLTITVLQLVFLVFLVVVFMALCFLMQPQTMGWL